MMVSSTQIATLYGDTPLESLDARVTPYSFRLKGWYHKLFGLDRDLEDRNRQTLWESTHLLPITHRMDLIYGFYHILMRERDIPYTAVSTPSGMLCEWLAIPQGISNAPDAFNRCVSHLLRPVRELAPSYFDDIFIHSRAMDGNSDVKVHRLHVRKVLTFMRKHKLYANLKKRIFAASETPLLGCIVGRYRSRKDQGDHRLSDVKGLRNFLGLAAYLYKYLCNYAEKSVYLSCLLKKNAKLLGLSRFKVDTRILGSALRPSTKFPRGVFPIRLKRSLISRQAYI